jgi:hypothetical protein
MSGRDSEVWESIFATIRLTAARIDETEEAYKKAKAAAAEELTVAVRSLAEIALTQASRATCIRTLFWEMNLPSVVIAEAFGLKRGQVVRVAGPYKVELTCATDGCDGMIGRSFTSRTEKLDVEKTRLTGKFDSVYYWPICDRCEQAKQLKLSEETMRHDEAERRRMQLLCELNWEDYIETSEWIEIRNSLVHEADYKCTLCGVSGGGLFVYLGVHTPQSLRRDYERQYYVLCRNCIPRCEGLLDDGRREYVKTEMMPVILNWAQGDMNSPYWGVTT